MGHICSARTWEAEVGIFLEASLGNTERQHLKVNELNTYNLI